MREWVDGASPGRWSELATGSEGLGAATSPAVRTSANVLLTREARVPLEESDLPFDAALPGLALLCDPPRLRATLAPVLPRWRGPGAELLESRAYLRRLVPSKRCTVELELLIGHGNGAVAERQRLLAKVYGESWSTTLFETLRELRRHGFGTGSLLVSEPLVYLPGPRLLLSTWTEGEPLASLLHAGRDADAEVRGAAEWLLALGQCGVRTGRRYSLRRHLHTLAGWKELLARAFPEGERLLTELMARFEEQSRSLPRFVLRPTHRDFSPEHIVVNGERITGLDLDEFCQYDPLFDVAHFVAQLRFLGLAHFGRLDHFDSLAQRFRATYEAGASSYLSERRLRLYEAIAYFKLGRFVALVPWSDGHLVRRPQGWREILPELLNEARRRL